MSVLLVEDDPALSRLLIAILGRVGVHADLVGRGDAAIEAIDADGDHYGAILLDLMLPVVSGFEILERMAATKPHLLNRVLVLTAVSNVELEKISCTARPRRIIRKPFDLTELRTAVLDCVSAFPVPGPAGEASRAVAT
jgi:DNA-binding response OmpR family regulator